MLVVVRLVGHKRAVPKGLGFIPSFADWVKAIHSELWTCAGVARHGERRVRRRRPSGLNPGQSALL